MADLFAPELVLYALYALLGDKITNFPHFLLPLGDRSTFLVGTGMKLRCPKCNRKLRPEDVDAAKDIAKCRRCNVTHGYVALTDVQKELPGNLSHPPAGAWFKRLPDGFEVGASTRSVHVFYLVPLACVVVCFVAGLAHGFWQTRDINRLTEMFFALLMMVTAGLPAAMAGWGHISVRVQGDDAVLFRGVGSLGWRRRFAWSTVTGIQISETNGDVPTKYIRISGPRGVSFGSGMAAERMRYLLMALQLMLRGHVPLAVAGKREQESSAKK